MLSRLCRHWYLVSACFYLQIQNKKQQNRYKMLKEKTAHKESCDIVDDDYSNFYYKTDTSCVIEVIVSER